MGSVYAGWRTGITPNTSNDNWTLSAASGEVGKIQMFGWGGGATSSTAVRTRLARPSTVGVTPTTATPAKISPQAGSNLVAFVTSWSTQPVIPAEPESLFAADWNAHGGEIIWVPPPGGEIHLIGNAAVQEVSCRNVAGTPTSSYGVQWEE